ncbi:tetratricopeptide repeat protein [Methanococcus maripaludis]|uniref:Tetratricopeptide (TPR) repeat protein n=2 Tax=Methanococcus maripaludis TaxID=39152 RepID=A0A7J9PG76_METMI|nr:tetratricopeptide repeat protein [Methanococcus maripaludis]MBA2861768.1 tetratricopeptide (TPR) repeat protein [Methanococcus maripaludis]
MKKLFLFIFGIILVSSFSGCTDNTDYVAKGDSYLSQGRYEMAILNYDIALDSIFYKINPNDEIYKNKGIALENLERYDESLSSYVRAYEIDPENIDTLCHVGNLLLKLERYNDALPYYEKALSIKPETEDALYGKARVLQFQENYAQANGYYDEVLILNENNTQALYNKGLTLQKIGKYSEANIYIERAKELTNAQN